MIELDMNNLGKTEFCCTFRLECHLLVNQYPINIVNQYSNDIRQSYSSYTYGHSILKYESIVFIH